MDLDLLSISAFARSVGLAPSALRFYDDCRVLLPARVDPVTGYRQYHPDQAGRARLLRGLREAGVPLADVAVVLDGTPGEARTVLAEHRERLGERAAAARAALDAVLGALDGSDGSDGSGGEVGGDPAEEIRISGAEFAAAVRQVAPAVARTAEHPELTRILLDVDPAEVRLVATDRYRFAMRTLRTAGGGTPRRLLLAVDELLELSRWAARSHELVLTGGGLRAADGTARPLPVRDGEYPDYRRMLDAFPEPAHRVLVDRLALRDALAEPVTVLSFAPDRLTAGAGELPAVSQGTPPPWRIAFDPEVLGPALEAGIGPDVLLELVGPQHPVVLRSADQGSFTTLVMPVPVP
ncbi:MerR family transcriptional regulator [Kitasatospora sp. NPDC096147]|uniref:DNA polymerase III subunit beta family protein n=1 Tax=Kitasatospora sp. NPDC096147 TaxID=3364093 RepID=UPI0037F5DDB9